MAEGLASWPQAAVCPVCERRLVALLAQIDGQNYGRCPVCHATILDPACRPSRQAEYRHYLSHENNVHDAGYRRFLARLAEPLLEHLAPGSSGLDYGCGPGPALADMLSEAGHTMAIYDPFFANAPAALDSAYDFVTCTETIEHFHDPAAEFRTFNRLLRPGGWLGLMTCFQDDDTRFTNWHYRHDPTHVVFYKRETLAFLAADLGWQFESPRKDVALMRKPEKTKP